MRNLNTLCSPHPAPSDHSQFLPLQDPLMLIQFNQRDAKITCQNVHIAIIVIPWCYQISGRRSLSKMAHISSSNILLLSWKNVLVFALKRPILFWQPNILAYLNGKFSAPLPGSHTVHSRNKSSKPNLSICLRPHFWKLVQLDRNVKSNSINEWTTAFRLSITIMCDRKDKPIQNLPPSNNLINVVGVYHLYMFVIPK